MQEYFNITVKKHKKLEKNLIFFEYINEDFNHDLKSLKEMVKVYMQELEKYSEKVIVIFDLRNVSTFNKKSVWEGSAELKRHDKFFFNHIVRSFIIVENKMAIQLLNIILKVVKTNVKTELSPDVKTILKNLE